MGLPIAASLTPALIALAGTLVGAFIAAFTNLGLARSQRRDQARASGRLVETDLQRALDFVKDWQSSYPDAPAGASAKRLDLDSWRESSRILAFALERTAWTRVSDGCLQVERLRRAVDSRRDPPSETHLETARERIEAAADALRRFDGG